MTPPLTHDRRRLAEEHFPLARRIAAVLGARCVNNPMWMSKRIITAHPVGGAPMGRDPSVGVCDPYGEVFGYPGLYIADGAATSLTTPEATT